MRCPSAQGDDMEVEGGDMVVVTLIPYPQSNLEQTWVAIIGLPSTSTHYSSSVSVGLSIFA